MHYSMHNNRHDLPPLHQHHVRILTRRERRISAWQRTITLGPPLHQIYGLMRKVLTSVSDVVKQDIKQKTALTRLYAPFRLLPLPHRKGFDHIWKNGQMLEGREDRPGASMTPEPLAHMNPHCALDVINSVISLLNVQLRSSVIIATRITWVLTVRLENAMPLRIWRNKPPLTNILFCR